ncbi:MAG TPA: hypothetical protein DCM73_07950 [Clostridiales bacterium]|nr:hypothetical protein [Clostridiales bacterium]
MRGYRLTGRGKFVFIVFVIVSLASVLGLKKAAMSGDGAEYAIRDAWYLSDPYCELDEMELSETAMAFISEMGEAHETFAGNSDFDDKEGFLSVNVEDIRSYDSGKLAFLTFDDGPSANVTPLVLDILDDYGIKATFFVLGCMGEKNGAVLNDINSRGHSIGIHSYSHNFKELYKSEKSFLNELKLSEDVLRQNLGDEFSTRLFRFPGGSFEDYKTQFVKALNDKGYVSVDWNAVTGDAESKNPTHEMLLERLKNTVENKNKIVVLMHDSAAKQVTAEALPDIIEYLISQGYRFAVLK